MSSIFIAGLPADGHVAPLLAIAEHLVARGDTVRFMTGARFAGKVRATGAAFLALPVDVELDGDIGELTARYPERAQLKGARAVAFDIEHVFARPALAEYNALVAACATQPVDAIIADTAFLGASLLLGHPRTERPAVVMCSITPMPLESPDVAPFGLGLPPARILNRPRNIALAALSRRVTRDARRTLDDHNRQLHGEPLPCSIFNWGRRADAIVQPTVPSFEYPMADTPTNLHFVGPLCGHSSPPPLPDWWSDLDGTRPVIHVTQGTAANFDYSQTIAPTLQALAHDDVLVVVATGGQPLDTLPPLPANARAATFLPYDELLPRTSVYVTNGGYGGVQYALRHGVPIVATGGKEDKPEVGARVAWSGVGRRIRSEQPSPRALRRAIHAVLDDARYRTAAERIAAEIATAPGFDGVAAIVDAVTQSHCTPTTPTQTRGQSWEIAAPDANRS